MIADKSNTVDILILSDDVVGPKMAGPGIRAWEIAYSLAKSFSVKLGIPDYSREGPGGDYFRDLPFQVFFYSPKNPGHRSAPDIIINWWLPFRTCRCLRCSQQHCWKS